MNDFGDTDALLEHEGDDERNIRKQKKKTDYKKTDYNSTPGPSG